MTNSPERVPLGSVQRAYQDGYAAAQQEIKQLRLALRRVLNAFDGRSHGGRVGWEEKVYQDGLRALEQKVDQT